MDPAVTIKRTLPPERLDSRITPTPDAYVIGHLGIARVAAPGWSLRVDGLVGSVLRIDLPQLRALPSVTVTAVPVTAVEIGVRGTWQRAELEPRDTGDFAWQRFSATRRLGPGDYRILARATDCRGRVQPRADARNQVHSVSLRVRGNG